MSELQDAERYRYLRNLPIECPEEDGVDVLFWNDGCGEAVRGNSLDRLIDEERGEPVGEAPPPYKELLFAYEDALDFLFVLCSEAPEDLRTHFRMRQVAKATQVRVEHFREYL